MYPKTFINESRLKSSHPFLNRLKSADSISGSYFWESELNLSDFPYLADHTFQGMTVLPGSVYLEMALAATAALGQRCNIIKNVDFQHLCILPANELVTLLLSLSPGETKEALFKCYSCSKDDNQTIHASMVIFQKMATEPSHLFTKPKLEEIQARSLEQIDGRDFYATLSENRNQYAPDFQGIQRLWLHAGEALGHVKIPSNLKSELAAYYFHPVLLDSCIQVLSATNRKIKQTFVLEGIAQVLIHGSPEDVYWSHAYLTSDRQNNSNCLVGDVHLLAESGKVVMELAGVRFKYIEHEELDSKLDGDPKNPIVISSTFTAEPLEDSLDFWRRTLGSPFKIEFAPYSQIFQQLLDYSSQTSMNKNGMNVILIRLEDWIRNENRIESTLSSDSKERLLAKKLRYILPNQLEIAYLNQYETEYLYKEIFVDQCYLRHGIKIHDGDCIIDIGANIGLFSLFVQQKCKDTIIYAFEPAPPIFELLDINTKLYGSNIDIFSHGISDRTKEADFTFYENSSVFSSFKADKEDDEKSIRAVIQNMLQDNITLDAEELESSIDDLTEGRLNGKSYICKLKSLSEVIKDNNIQEINLLKIDAEKSELDILKGIKDIHWKIIKQIVMEVHDKKGVVIEDIKHLLKEKGFDFEIEEEQMLHTSGLCNIYATRSTENDNVIWTDSSLAVKKRSVEKNVKDFIVALKASVAKNPSIPYLICFCPVSPVALADKGVELFFKKMEEFLLSELVNINSVHTIKSSVPNAIYQIDNFYDHHGDKLGHVPYTSTYFTALGTVIIRKFYALRSVPYKVVVLDCDNTLWKGVLGEDGPYGIIIEPPYHKLQEFMVKQIDAGMLICLCSKNVEEDIVDVFRLRTEMPLKRNHIVSWRINWSSKSDNIKSLAHQLQLGLESFIFIDDNPVECAEVEVNCPEVLTLLLPNEPEEIPRFLEHIWAFDHAKVTNVDIKRTLLYQQNLKREEFRKKSMTLEGFLADLELKIQISGPDAKNIARVSQLTYRTNQFNFTTIRRSESEISELLQSGKMECLIAKVSDRFGDYGLVGVILFETDSDTIRVDTCLLSCRVLGRGIEHYMLARLGGIAHERKVSHVIVNYIKTQKNKPALVFLNGLGSQFKHQTEQGFFFKFPAQHLKKVTYRPGSEKLKSFEKADFKEIFSKHSEKKDTDTLLNSNILTHIANNYYSAKKILHSIESYNNKQRLDLKTEYILPGNELERSVANTWQKILGISRVGIQDNFSDIGGTSLKGIQLIALLKRELNIDISIIDLFEYPTVSSMAKMLANKGSQEKKEVALTSRTRGERRRSKRRPKV